MEKLKYLEVSKIDLEFLKKYQCSKRNYDEFQYLSDEYRRYMKEIFAQIGTYTQQIEIIEKKKEKLHDEAEREWGPIHRFFESNKEALKLIEERAFDDWMSFSYEETREFGHDMDRYIRDEIEKALVEEQRGYIGSTEHQMFSYRKAKELIADRPSDEK